MPNWNDLVFLFQQIPIWWRQAQSLNISSPECRIMPGLQEALYPCWWGWNKPNQASTEENSWVVSKPLAYTADHTVIGSFEQKYSNTWQTSSLPHLLLSHVWTLPRRGKNSNGKMCTDILATAVITVKTWKQSKCLTGKWLSKQWDYYIAIKNDRGENCQHGELCTGRNWQEQ